MKKNITDSIFGAVVLLVLAFAVAPPAHSQTETVLYNFTGGVDGGLPSAGLIFDVSGNLYSTTYSGGGQGWGVVYKLSRGGGGSWSESVLHSFSYSEGNPAGGLTLDRGRLFGATIGFLGNIFKLTPATNGTWTEKIITGFNGSFFACCPQAPVVFDVGGNLYAAGTYGGVANVCPAGCGLVFRLKSTVWKPLILHSFGFSTDGAWPLTGVVLDASGAVYGTTSAAGDFQNCLYKGNGCGTVFKLAEGSHGSAVTVLHSFTGGSDGYVAVGNLTLDAAGNVYGATIQGGDPVCNCGVIFEISQQPDGTYQETVLHTFTGGADGYNPNGNLIFDSAGNLYGTTYAGGDLNVCSPQGCGLVFKLSPSSNGWTETVLYTFEGGNDGSNPAGGLLFGAAGNLYGTAQLGGQYGNGVVFEITP